MRAGQAVFKPLNEQRELTQNWIREYARRATHMNSWPISGHAARARSGKRACLNPRAAG